MEEQIISSRSSHDSLIQNLFKELENADERKYVDHFLYSFSTNDLRYRSGLPVLAIMKSFPKHHFLRPSLPENYQNLNSADKEFADNRAPCEICSSLKSVEIDEHLVKECFEEVGGLISHSLPDYYYYLKWSSNLPISQPRQIDLEIFNNLLEILATAGREETAKEEIQKKNRQG